MNLYIDENTRKSLGREVGLSILQRGDMLARDMLDQLRKSTDRAYTMLGLLLTAFSAVTGFIFAVGLSPVIVPLFVLWTGLIISLYILFTKAVWVNKFSPCGNDPEHLISQKNISMLQGKFADHDAVQRQYELNLIYDNIEQCQYCIDINEKALEARVGGIHRTMKVLKVTFVASIIASLPMLVVYLFL